MKSFGTQRADAERFAGPSLLSAEEIRVYVAADGDDDVAMALTSRHEGSVGVFGVATVPDARRRGIGTALTAFAVHDAPDVDLAWLQPTSMGFAMYAAMGFLDASAWEVWVRRA